MELAGAVKKITLHTHTHACCAASASHRAPRARRGILMGAGDSRTPRVLPPHPLGVHNGHVLGLRRAPRGSGAAHGTTRRSATPAQMEHVHAPALRDALRDAETHPVMLDRLGVHVVAVLGAARK